MPVHTAMFLGTLDLYAHCFPKVLYFASRELKCPILDNEVKKLKKQKFSPMVNVAQRSRRCARFMKKT
jgi:hypothetical protein